MGFLRPALAFMLLGSSLCADPDPQTRQKLSPQVTEAQAQACVNVAIALAKRDSEFHQTLTGLPLDYPRLPQTEWTQEIDSQAVAADLFNGQYPSYSTANQSLAILHQQMGDAAWIAQVQPLIITDYPVRNPVLDEIEKLVDGAEGMRSPATQIIPTAIRNARARHTLSAAQADELLKRVTKSSPQEFDQLQVVMTKIAAKTHAPVLALKPQTLPLNSVEKKRTEPYPQMPMQMRYFFEQQGLSQYQFATSSRYFGAREQTYASPAEKARRKLSFDPDGTIRTADGRLLNTLSPVAVVMDKDGNWYVGHHDYLYETSIGVDSVTSFGHGALSGGEPQAFAGMMQAVNGELLSLDRNSGHFLTPLPYLLQGVEDLERRQAFHRERDRDKIHLSLADRTRF